VTQKLRGLVRDGRTIIATVQPSSEVFKLFDSLYLLSGGKTVNFGNAYCEVVYMNEIAHILVYVSALATVSLNHVVSCPFCSFIARWLPMPTTAQSINHFLGSVNSDYDKVKATLTALVIFLFMKKAFLQLSCFSQIISFVVHLRKSEQWVKFYQRLEYDSCED
jgi:hypothetical protein